MELFQKYFDTALDSKNGIKKLREMILTLAMKGKLIPQNPADQPASELIKVIHAEKAKLIKEGKIKKQKDLPPIKPEEIPYQLPNGWEWVRLGEYCQIIMGQSPESSSYNANQDGLPFYQGKADFGSLYPTPRVWCSNPQKIAPINSILISVRAPVGPTNLCAEESCIGRGLSALVVLGNTSEHFLLYTLRLFENKLAAYGTGSTFVAITLKVLDNFIIPLPPLAEQKRIVEKIDSLMAKCDELEKLKKEKVQKRLDVHKSAVHALLNSGNVKESWQFIKSNFSELYTVKENVAELRKAILQLAMMGKLVPQDPADQPASELLKEIQAEKAKLIKEGKIKKQKDLPSIKPEEIPYELPPSWKWARLGNILLKLTDGTHHSPTNTASGDFMYISAKHIKDEGIILKDITYVSADVHAEIFERCNPEYGDILYIKDGATTGITTINNIKEAFSMLSSVALLKLPNTIINYFLLYLLRSPYFYDSMRADMSGVAITRVTLKKLNLAFIPLPPLAEQKRIVEKIDSLMAMCDELEKQITESDNKKFAILNSLTAQA